MEAASEELIRLQERVEILKRIAEYNLLCEDIACAIFGWDPLEKADPLQRIREKAKPIMTKKQKEEMAGSDTIAGMYREGISKTEIARRMGLPWSTVDKKLKDAGILPKKKQIDTDKVIALRKANPPRSVAWIARDMKCKEETVVEILKENGLWEEEENE
jgi:DNA-binding transcriptional ArsR family regulator